MRARRLAEISLFERLAKYRKSWYSMRRMQGTAIRGVGVHKPSGGSLGAHSDSDDFFAHHLNNPFDGALEISDSLLYARSDSKKSLPRLAESASDERPNTTKRATEQKKSIEHKVEKKPTRKRLTETKTRERLLTRRTKTKKSRVDDGLGYLRVREKGLVKLSDIVIASLDKASGKEVARPEQSVQVEEPASTARTNYEEFAEILTRARTRTRRRGYNVFDFARDYAAEKRLNGVAGIAVEAIDLDGQQTSSSSSMAKTQKAIGKVFFRLLFRVA